jgi:S-adenosylmethionine hydrolase
MPLITLLTDFGTADPYVAEMRGVLYQAPGVTLSDLNPRSRPVMPLRHLLGALHRCPRAPYLVVVDRASGPGAPRSPSAPAGTGSSVRQRSLSSVLDLLDTMPVAIPEPPDAAPTFHGRDVFAPAAASLAMGLGPDRLGEPLITVPVRLTNPEPVYQGKTVVGEVISVDQFGNLITNLTTNEVPPYGIVEVEELEVGALSRTFSDVQSGHLLAYVGSGGQIEIAVRDGSAARRLGIGVGGRVRVRLG